MKTTTKTHRERRKSKHPVTVIDGVRIRHMGPDRFLVDHRRDGVNRRRSFKTMGEAETYARQIVIERMNRGTRAFSLTDPQRLDALDALKILGAGCTLTEAAKEYRRRHPASGGETVRELIARRAADMETDGLRDVSIVAARRHYETFARHVGEGTLASGLDRSDVAGWVKAGGWQGVTRSNYLRAGYTLLHFRDGTLKKRTGRNDKPVTVWDVPTVKRIMIGAAKHEPGIIAPLAVLFFAGVRPHEMMRLSWNSIDIEAGEIRIEGEGSKTRSARVIDMPDNLKSWLVKYRGTGPLVESPSWYRRRREALMRKIKLSAWPSDVTRHSFASYLYATKKDAGYVASMLGHWQGLDVLARHYRSVARMADAQKYWNIRPASAGRNIIRFKKAAGQ